MWQIQSECVGPDGSIRYFWVPNVGNAYVVGDEGSVWSRYQGRGRNCYISNNWTRLSPGVDGAGYLFVGLFFNGNKYQKGVHQLVCEAVWGSCPAGLEVCHNDGHRFNNNWWNLRYDTHAGNHADQIIHGTSLAGENHNMAKLNWLKVREIRAKYVTGKYSLVRLGMEYRVNRTNIYYIVTNQTWVE